MPITLAAAGLPQIPRLTGEARSYAERKHAWNLADGSPITRSDIEDAMPAAQVALDASIYEVRIQRATDQERRYMRAMAELGSGPYRSAHVATSSVARRRGCR